MEGVRNQNGLFLHYKAFKSQCLVITGATDASFGPGDAFLWGSRLVRDVNRMRAEMGFCIRAAFFTIGMRVQIGGTGCCQNSRLKGKGIAPFNPQQLWLGTKIGKLGRRPYATLAFLSWFAAPTKPAYYEPMPPVGSTFTYLWATWKTTTALSMQ